MATIEEKSEVRIPRLNTAVLKQDLDVAVLAAFQQLGYDCLARPPQRGGRARLGYDRPTEQLIRYILGCPERLDSLLELCETWCSSTLPNRQQFRDAMVCSYCIPYVIIALAPPPVTRIFSQNTRRTFRAGGRVRLGTRLICRLVSKCNLIGVDSSNCVNR